MAPLIPAVGESQALRPARGCKDVGRVDLRASAGRTERWGWKRRSSAKC
jgi:hypothetical protein